jgi:hypothetical protein
LLCGCHHHCRIAVITQLSPSSQGCVVIVVMGCRARIGPPQAGSSSMVDVHTSLNKTQVSGEFRAMGLEGCVLMSSVPVSGALECTKDVSAVTLPWWEVMHGSCVAVGGP